MRMEFDKEGKVIGFYCTRKDIGALPNQEIDNRTEKQKLLDQLKKVTKPKLIENENLDNQI